MRFPTPCVFCAAESADGICKKCAQDLERACLYKRQSLPYLEAADTLFDYDAPHVQKALFLLKRRGLRVLCKHAAPLLSSVAASMGRAFVCVTYVPRRRSMVCRTGVDQAKLLARAVAKGLGIPCVSLLRRHGISRRQHDLTREARVENVRGKFRKTTSLSGGEVLLVDDVITTGATVSECARVLLQAGAGRVFVLAPVRGGWF